MATGKNLQAYFNPEMGMPAGAQGVHGLSDAFLSDKPLFADRAAEMMDFIGDARLVIHNAQFDLGFLNAELARVGLPKLANEYVDTVSMARRKFPGQWLTLESLCERLGVDNAHRTRHGALLDAELLAEVYLELSGGRQRNLGLAAEIGRAAFSAGGLAAGVEIKVARVFPVNADEFAAHVEFVKTKLKDALWLEEAGA